MQPSIQMLAQGEIEHIDATSRGLLHEVDPFSPRCPRSIENLCTIEKPQVREIAGRHHIACHMDEETFQSMKPGKSIKDKHADDGALLV
jgi:hypothetical protein